MVRERLLEELVLDGLLNARKSKVCKDLGEHSWLKVLCRNRLDVRELQDACRAVVWGGREEWGF